MDYTVHISEFWLGALVISGVWVVGIMLYTAYDRWAKRTFR